MNFKKTVFKSLVTSKLKKNEIDKIFKFKNTNWKYSIRSQLKWFHQNIQNEDVHNLVYINKELIGYNLLRKRIFYVKNFFSPYFYFDTIIILKKFRGLKIGHQLCNFSGKIIKKKKLHSMLICKKNLVSFYSKYKWKKKLKKNIVILDHTYPKNYSIMIYNQQHDLLKKKIKYLLFT